MFLGTSVMVHGHAKAVAMWVYCYDCETHRGTLEFVWVYCYETLHGTLEFVFVEVIGTHAYLFPPFFVIRRCQYATLASDWTSRHVCHMPSVTKTLVTMPLVTTLDQQARSSHSLGYFDSVLYDPNKKPHT